MRIPPPPLFFCHFTVRHRQTYVRENAYTVPCILYTPETKNWGTTILTTWLSQAVDGCEI
jgi:hypothetical protein